MAGIDMLLGEASIAENDRKTQQQNLFGEAEVADSAVLPSAAPWSTMDRLAREYDAIGFFLTGHPLDDYQTALKRIRVASLAELEARVESEVMVAGAVIKVDERKSSKTGKPFAFVALSDATGQFDVMLFSEALNGARDYLNVGALVVATVRIEREDGQLRLLGSAMRPVDEMIANAAEGLRIYIEQPEACAGVQARLVDIQKPKHKSGGEVSLVMMSPDREVELRLPNKYAVTPRVAGAIKAVPGVLHVEEL